MKQNRARYSTTCYKCQEPIFGEQTGTKGDFIQWSKKPPVRRYHVNCDNPQVWPYPGDNGSPQGKPYETPKQETYFCQTCQTHHEVGYIHPKEPKQRQPAPQDLDEICSTCGYRAGDHQNNSLNCPIQGRGAVLGYHSTVFSHKQTPELPNPQNDELFDMKIPEEKPANCARCNGYHFSPECPKPNGNGSDALLDLISERVESKVLDDIRKKVDSAIQVIDRNVKEKLDKLAIPSIEVKRVGLPNIKLNNVHKQFKDVLQLLSSGEHVYLHGSPGGHKTTLGPQLAEALGVRFEGCSLSEQTPDYTIKGFTSPIDGKFYESNFCNFYENGGLWQWSEIDAANDNFRVSLNTALDNGYMSTDKGSINRHDKFYMVADGNTCGRGAHPAFPSRTAFDSAFAARFIFVQFEYDWSLCKHIALGLNKQAGPIVSWAEKVSNWALVNGVQLVMSPREVYKLAKLMVTTTLSDSMLLDGILRGLDVASKEKLLTNYPFPSITRNQV